MKHLAAVEYGWFCETFGGQAEPLPFDPDDENAELRVLPHETTADIVQFYGRARAAADRVSDGLDLDDVGKAWFREAGSLRWVLIHLIEETARHAGYVLAEQVTPGPDSPEGDYPAEIAAWLLARRATTVRRAARC